LLVTPLLLQSIGGYLWLAVHVHARGGRVITEPLSGPDVMTCGALGFALVQLAVFSIYLSTKAPAGTVRVLKPAEVLQFPILLILVCACIAGLLMFRRVSLVEFFGLRRLPLWKVALWGIALLVLAWPGVIAIAEVVSQFLPKAVSDEQQVVGLFRSDVKQGHYTGIASIVGAAVVLAPLGEEFLFRGYFYAVGKRYFGATASAFATAALFAFVHVNAASFAGLFALALCLTVAYEYTGSLLVPMSMHALFNAANLLVIVDQALNQPS
jgi:membrane protease YdiL (CAAX protease family)